MLRAFKPKFVSKVDDFLMKFDRAYPVKSATQQLEIAKHQRIADLRDGTSIPLVTPDETKIWGNF